MSQNHRRFVVFFVFVISAVWLAAAPAQTLDDELRMTPARELAARARTEGDAARGAVVFFQPHMACAKCHSVGGSQPSPLGPDLVTVGKDAGDEAIVEAVLLPSKVIRKGFEAVTISTVAGQTLTGLVVERAKDKLTFRDLNRGGEVSSLIASDIEDVRPNPLSIMPAGQMNQLASRQQFLDLIRYLIEVRDGGVLRARELQPPLTLITLKIPEYEQRIDHAGLIRSWNADSLKRGEAIYRRVCQNCHGTREQPGSLPTSLRFAEGKFKNGSEPLAMYQTLTRGFGLMAAQTWMVPSQKYDVIHYIRETYLRPHNVSQLAAVDDQYLAKLPKGDTRGPEPSKIQPWSAMDYGPSLTHTFEIPGGDKNFAYKGIAVRLDPGAGGVSRGAHWMLFDTDTLRLAAAWSSAKSGAAKDADNFINWRGIQFNGEHQIHPTIVGEVTLANGIGPGWGRPRDASFADDQRVVGRDGRKYGPLPREWGRFRGLYHHGQKVVFSYSLGSAEILESPRMEVRGEANAAPLFVRTFNIGPREHDLLLQVADHPGAQAAVAASGRAANGASAGAAAALRLSHAAPANDETNDTQPTTFAFDGRSFLEVANSGDFDFTGQDFSITARMKTKAGGTLFAIAQPNDKWSPNGQTFFVRGGRLGFDIGWVGAVVGKAKVDDGRWHHVAVTWQHTERRVRLFVDGKLDVEGTLAAKAKLADGVARIGFTSPNFPQPQSFFQGELSEVRFYQRQLAAGPTDFAEPNAAEKEKLVGRWLLDETALVRGAAGAPSRLVCRDTTGQKHDAAVRRRAEAATPQIAPLLVGLAPVIPAASWSADDDHLRLRIPAGSAPLRFSLWTTTDAPDSENAARKNAERRSPTSSVSLTDSEQDLREFTQGGPPRWAQRITTTAALGPNNGPFASDVLTAPESNPWLAQTRFTGLDFFADGRIAVCSWDGDVWIVEQSASSSELRWQRIASGLFQPLGLKIIQEKIYVTCRDQLAVLHDLNRDGEIDFYECLNNDHQVTEHFHEFAMGLQTDAAGNFYYAKSARHALPAVVPHHGTLLRISSDGSRTDILANGFRAANGVCLNPDGSFVVTDQEGHWNPKNRINWVTLRSDGRPNFYGNMFGYHDVTDPSDSAMQPPLCWITNAFDRSPGELLWVNSRRWGALDGSLLNLSYGYGKVFLVPHETVNGQPQGGMIELPIPSFPTGVMRGRFHPGDQQLYLCGMFAWAGSATHPGGLYRLRATGQAIHLPTQLRATESALKMTFSEPLDPASISPTNLQIKTWSLKRAAGYGSKHYDEQPLPIRDASLSADGKTLTIAADVRPTWCMEIRFAVKSATGQPVVGTIHNTIHQLGK